VRWRDRFISANRADWSEDHLDGVLRREFRLGMTPDMVRVCLGSKPVRAVRQIHNGDKYVAWYWPRNRHDGWIDLTVVFHNDEMVLVEQGDTTISVSDAETLGSIGILIKLAGLRYYDPNSEPPQ